MCGRSLACVNKYGSFIVTYPIGYTSYINAVTDNCAIKKGIIDDDHTDIPYPPIENPVHILK